MIDRDWLDKVATAADVYCRLPGSNEKEIDRFLEYLFKVYGYADLLEIRKIKKQ